VRVLTNSPSLSFIRLGEQVKDGFEKTDLPWLSELLDGLLRDGLVAIDRRRRIARLP